MIILGNIIKYPYNTKHMPIYFHYLDFYYILFTLLVKYSKTLVKYGRI